MPEYKNGNVSAYCPDCGGAVTTYEHKNAISTHGIVIQNVHHRFVRSVLSENTVFAFTLRILWPRLNSQSSRQWCCFVDGTLEAFYQTCIDSAKLPGGTPHGVAAEFRETELCASVGAWRAASGLLRSTLEKLLRVDGYAKGSLANRIDLAATDSVITEARKRRAHDEVRVLGNYVLHNDCRQVTPEEVTLAHHYVQRVTEDLYDDRTSAESRPHRTGQTEGLRWLTAGWIFTRLLNWRARHISIRAINTAIPYLGAKQLSTRFTLIKILAKICGHCFQFLEPTIRAGNRRL